MPIDHSQVRVDIIEVELQDAMNEMIECVIMEPGEKQVVFIGDSFGMSDTALLRAASAEIVWQARGHVLLVGLGLGVVLLPIMQKPEVTKVTVIDNSSELIDKVGKAFLTQPGGEKVELVTADIYEWAPDEGTKFDTMWLDIWTVRDFANLAKHEAMFELLKPYFNEETGWWSAFFRAEMLDLKRMAATYRKVLDLIIEDPNIPGSLEMTKNAS